MGTKLKELVVSKFYSVPGLKSYGGEGSANLAGFKGRKMERNPRAEAYYKARDETRDTASGFTPGDKVMYNGECAEVIHEEYNKGTGEIDTIIKKNDSTSSGTRKVTWAKKRDGEIFIDRTKPIFE